MIEAPSAPARPVRVAMDRQVVSPTLRSHGGVSGPGLGDRRRQLRTALTRRLSLREQHGTLAPADDAVRDAAQHEPAEIGESP